MFMSVNRDSCKNHRTFHTAINQKNAAVVYWIAEHETWVVDCDGVLYIRTNLSTLDYTFKTAYGRV